MVEAVKEDAVKVKKKRKVVKRLTSAEWGSAGAMWESGQYTLMDLSERFGLTREAMSRKFSKEGLKKGQNAGLSEEAVRGVIEKKVRESAEFGTDAIALNIVKVRSKGYDFLEAAKNSAAKTMALAAKNGEPIGKYKDDIKTLSEIVNIFEKAGTAQLALLGVKNGEFPETSESLPELSIVKMTDEQVEEVIRQSEVSMGCGDLPDDDDDDMGVDGE